MKVLAIVQAWNSADPIRGFIVRWMEKISEHVESLVVLTLEQREPSRRPNVIIYSLGKEHGPRLARRLQYGLKWHRSMTRIMSAHDPDVIFTHMSPIFSVLASPYAKLKGIPIVTWYAHPQLTLAVKTAHLVSARITASLSTAYPYRKDKLAVVGQGIDTDHFVPDGARGGHEPPLILCAGRLSPVKDHSTLFRAAELLKDRGKKPFRVAIVGGPLSPSDELYIRQLHDRVNAMGLDDMVSFEGPATIAELPRWYQHCAVHVNLTPTGFGDKVAWEAMACGKPCIVANEGFQETIGPYWDLLSFRAGDARGLAEALDRVLSLSGEERSCIGEALREQVVKLHSLDGLAGRLAGLFEEVRAAS